MSEELKRGIPKAVVIGHKEFSDEEKEKYVRETEELLRKYGVLSDDDIIKNGKIIQK